MTPESLSAETNIAAGPATGQPASARRALTRTVKGEALRLGFSMVGITPAIAASGAAKLEQWLELGYAGEMSYLARRQAAYRHPRHVLEGVRSLVMLALPYRTADPPALAAGEARVSRYAWGESDYHDVIHDKLKQLGQQLVEHSAGAVVRGVVDSAPLLEREFAQRAGLGWIGKHTLLLHRQAGSYFFLAALLTDAELEYDQPFAADHCGSCTACLDACPTQAFPQPYVLDATRCISYLTIELRGPVPLELRAGVGDWLFGCDVCQDVCPWNRKAPSTAEPAFQPVSGSIDAVELLSMDEEEFRRRFRTTPLWRSKRRGILRNAAIVLGNQKRAETVPALVRALADVEPLVRGAAAWALGEIGGGEAIAALRQRRQAESEGEVMAELEAALARHDSAGEPGQAAASPHSP